MQCSEKLWKIFENIMILSLQQHNKIRNYLLSELNYHTIKFFTENLLAIKTRKTQTIMNKPIYLIYQY